MRRFCVKRPVSVVLPASSRPMRRIVFGFEPDDPHPRQNHAYSISVSRIQEKNDHIVALWFPFAFDLFSKVFKPLRCMPSCDRTRHVTSHVGRFTWDRVISKDFPRTKIEGKSLPRSSSKTSFITEDYSYCHFQLKFIFIRLRCTPVWSILCENVLVQNPALTWHKNSMIVKHFSNKDDYFCMLCSSFTLPSAIVSFSASSSSFWSDDDVFSSSSCSFEPWRRTTMNDVDVLLTSIWKVNEQVDSIDLEQK